MIFQYKKFEIVFYFVILEINLWRKIMFKDINNLVELFYNAYSKYPDKIFLKYRETNNPEEGFKSLTFKEFKERMENLAIGLYHIGLRKGDKVGILSDNRYQWLLADLAILSLGAIDVPRGSDSTEEEMKYILKHSGAKFCFVEDSLQADKILKIQFSLPHLRRIILITGAKKDIKHKIHIGVNLYTFEQILNYGKRYKDKYMSIVENLKESIKPEDIATLIYTSGTTGPPKGVMLMHKNIMHNVKSLPKILPLSSKDRWVSILPVWHIFERTVEYIIMGMGCLIAYSKPTANFLLKDLGAIRPTYMASVPRVWESIYNGIMKNINSEPKIKQNLFNFFVSIGKIYKKSFKILTNEIALFHNELPIIKILKKFFAFFCVLFLLPFYKLGDLLVFSKIKKKTGGCLKGPISGGGALPSYVDEFFSAIGMEILEGYGLTETSPVISVRTFKRKVLKTVGPPIPGVEVKICNEKGEKLKNQHKKGLIFVKGDLVMLGYYNDEQATKRVLRDDGWFNTGDLGRLTITGEIQITGRAKDTIVLIGGENIEPAPIEEKLCENPLISQVMVYGQDQKRLSAIIVPDEENLKNFAMENGIKYHSFRRLCKHPKILEKYNEIIDSTINTKNGFKSFERIYCFLLTPQVFRVGKELTHTLKLKRNVIAKKYKKQIERIYYKKFKD